VLSVYLKMDKMEYRAVITFFENKVSRQMRFIRKFIKVCGDSSPSFSTIKEWSAEFNPYPSNVVNIVSS
jgi:hypothetical protein